MYLWQGNGKRDDPSYITSNQHSKWQQDKCPKIIHVDSRLSSVKKEQSRMEKNSCSFSTCRRLHVNVKNFLVIFALKSVSSNASMIVIMKVDCCTINYSWIYILIAKWVILQFIIYFHLENVYIIIYKTNLRIGIHILVYCRSNIKHFKNELTKKNFEKI